MSCSAPERAPAMAAQFSRGGDGALRYIGRAPADLVAQAMAVATEQAFIGGHQYAGSDIGRGSGPLALRNDKGSMRARYIIESERWQEMKGQNAFDNIDELFALGVAAAKLDDVDRAVAAREELIKASHPSMDAGPLVRQLAHFDFSWFVPAIVKYRKLFGEVLLLSLIHI